MEPIPQNLLAMLWTFVYIKSVISVCDWAVRRHLVSQLIARKTVHVAAACDCLFWPLFRTQHWTWLLNLAVPVLYALQLLVKGLLVADPNDEDVRTMTHTGRPIELCQGPLFFAMVLIYSSVFHFKQSTGTYLMAAMGFGDGVAPVVGVYFPYGYYRSPPMGFGDGSFKTLSGSAGVFVGTLVGIWVLRSVLGAPEMLYAVQVIGVALTATVAEAVSGKWDNLVIPVSVYCYLQVTAALLEGDR